MPGTVKLWVPPQHSRGVSPVYARYLMRLTPSTLCVFYLYDSENDELVARHASGYECA